MNDSKIVYNLKEMTMTGHKNAAICALSSLLSLMPGGDIDEESFKEIAKDLPDYEGPGFLIQSVEDLNFLCNFGNFSIVEIEGKITAVKA